WNGPGSAAQHLAALRAALRPGHALYRRAVSFDHLMGGGDELVRHLEPERIRGLEVDDKLEFGRLLDRQVAGPFTLEDAIDIARRLPVAPPHLNPPRHQAAARDEVAERIDRRQAVP